MKKNVASQVVGAQMISATDGSAFTGAVTVHVTGDGGTQATGSVGSGACTHEGNGFHTYAPAQAETNFDHVAFTFTGTGAIPATVQIYTTFPQTGDNFARLGAPAGASVSADVAAIKAETASIQTDTNDIQTRLPAALVSGRIDASIGAMDANTLTASALAADAVAEIQSGLSTLDAAGVRSAVGLANANLDTQIDALPTAAENATAVWGAGSRTLTALDEDSTTLDLDATIRAAVGMTSANLDTQLAAIDDAVDTEVGAIKAVTDKLDNTLENTSDGWIFTVNGLQNAPSGTGASASDIADEVQTRTIAAVTTVNGLANNSVTAAALAADAVAEIQSGLATAAALATVDTVADAIKVTTDKLDGMVENTSDGWIWTLAALQNAPAGGSGLDAAGVRAAIGLASANLDTQLGDLPTAAENATAVWGAGARTLTALDEDSTTIDLDATVRGAVGLASANLDTQLDALPTAVENADALLDRNMASGADNGSTTVRTPRQALRILRNRWTIDSDGEQTIMKEDDSTPSWTQQLATDGSAQPVTGTDPAGP